MNKYCVTLRLTHANGEVETRLVGVDNAADLNEATDLALRQVETFDGDVEVVDADTLSTELE